MGHLDDLAAALAPYRNSLEFYAPRVLTIKTKAGQLAPLRLNSAQIYVHNQIQDQLQRTGKVRKLIVKGRQQGISTYIEARYYWRTSLNFGLRAFILTHLDEATANLFGMTRRFHEKMPSLAVEAGLRPATKAANANALAFRDLDSEFSVATAQSKETGRSATAQLFHGSEVGFWANAAEHMAGIGQIIPNEPGTEIILESTGNGEGNLFHGMVLDAVRLRGEYELIFVPWYWQREYRLPCPPDFSLDATPPGEDELSEVEYAEKYGLDNEQMHWRRAKIRDDFRDDQTLFNQEYPAEVLLAFARQAKESWIKSKWVARALRTQLEPSPNAPEIWGLDIGEYGEDDTCLARRKGRVVKDVERWHGLGVMETVGRVAKHYAEAVKAGSAPQWVNVDVTGVGSGAADRLAELHVPVRRIHFGERPIEPTLYAIRGDEMWGEMQEWFKDAPNSIRVVAKGEEALKADLTGRSYGYDSSRRLRMESKEKMKERGLRSPDAGDAIALTFAVPAPPMAHGTIQAKHEWRASRAGDWRANL